MKSIIILHLFAILLSSPAFAQDREKVILDSDMVEAFDDGIAMMMLAKAPNIELLGVTIVVGNTWVSEGVTYAAKQLKSIGKEDIPVIPGINMPLSPNRFDTIKGEGKLFGIDDIFVGAAGYPDPSAKSASNEMNAVNFIIEQVKKNPGEISIIAIGPCTNLAVAIRIAPEIIPLIKRVIYMGGAFFTAGNTTPSAEFNWWIDPEAAKMCVRAPFNEQIIVSLDVCEKMPFGKSQYEKIIRLTSNEEIQEAMNRNLQNGLFADPSVNTNYIWDVIAGAIMIAPSLVTDDVIRYVDVNSQFGFNYGQSIAYNKNQPTGTQKARIILSVNRDRLWDMIENYCKEF